MKRRHGGGSAAEVVQPRLSSLLIDTRVLEATRQEWRRRRQLEAELARREAKRAAERELLFELVHLTELAARVGVELRLRRVVDL